MFFVPELGQSLLTMGNMYSLRYFSILVPLQQLQDKLLTPTFGPGKSALWRLSGLASRPRLLRWLCVLATLQGPCVWAGERTGRDAQRGRLPSTSFNTTIL